MRQLSRSCLLLADVLDYDLAWAMPLIKGLPNAHIEISRFFLTNGISRLLDAVGHERILFGSGFPDSSMSPQRYNLHLIGLFNNVLAAICAGNLERLLGIQRS